ncbi:peroxisome assembly protein 12 isoform X2 [Cylas formicarius]|uniref:peroxisome assembly protein 12 isoform X2 n=1 Tax=Cylas formicarius TaxID=197179 RepID=UPI0029586DDF|nr:peroxisome assembly protein 12 isoform X2 [Cylas formicarius]
MAESAANFTRTFQSKPSVFEIAAQKSLSETLHPGLRRVALFLSTNFPRKFRFLNDYFDETFFALHGLLELYYLRYYDASFSENFYGLKRVASNGSELTKHDREISLIVLVALPYFKRKIDEKIQLYKIENAEGSLRKDLEGRLKKIALYSYSALEVIRGFATVNNYLRYMSNKTESQLLILKVLKLKLAYSYEPPSPSFWGAFFRGQLWSSDLSWNVIRNGVTSVFELAAFFLQFLNTWNAHHPNYNWTDLPKVEAPPAHVKAGAYRDRCPICLGKWLNPTVLPISGYVFCFRCIIRHLNETPECPVTRFPARPLDVARLYPND